MNRTENTGELNCIKLKHEVRKYKNNCLRSAHPAEATRRLDLLRNAGSSPKEGRSAWPQLLAGVIKCGAPWVFQKQVKNRPRAFQNLPRRGPDLPKSRPGGSKINPGAFQDAILKDP